MTRLSQPTLSVDQELHDALTLAQDDQWAVVVKPPKDLADDPLGAAESLFQSTHDEFDRFSFELHQTSRGAIEFHFAAEERAEADRLMQQILSAYPTAEADIEQASLPIAPGDVITAGRIEYAEDHLFPIRNANSADPPNGDPYRAFLDTMANSGGKQCVLQTVVEPVGNSWTTRWARGIPYKRENDRWWKLPASRDTRLDALRSSIALTLLTAGGWYLVTQFFAYGGPIMTTLFVGLGLLTVAWWWATLFGHGHLPRRWPADEQAQALRDKNWTTAKPTRGERRTADQIAEQAREDSYRVSMRVLSIGDSSSEVRDYLDRIESQFSNAFHDRDSTQRLTMTPIRPLAWRVRGFVHRLARRTPGRDRVRRATNKALTRARRRRPMFMTRRELASLAHLPDENSGGAGAIDYAAPRLRTRVPPAAPRYHRPGEDTEEARAIGKNAPLVRAGRMLLDRLPGISLNENDDDLPATIPSWATDETALIVDPDHRETANHLRYGDVELKLVEEGDPTDPDDSGEVYMGAFLREIIESKQQRPRGDLLIGYQKIGGQVREVCVPFDTIFTHIFIQGVTGAGKSTLAGVLLAQWAHAGYGFAVPDPSGQLIKDILRWLPEHRHDDVVHYSPEPDVAQKIVGINPFSIARQPDDQDYGGAVDQAVDAVENGLRAAEEGDQWGARMIGVCRNLSRVMIRSDEPFTLVDLHDALSSEEGREKLAERAGKTDEWVEKYTKKIAAFDDEELDALLRRLNEWVESTVSRTTIAVRESSLDLDEIVHEEKILLFDNKLSNSALSRMLATVVWSKIWTICERRPEDEREPFAVLGDEFDDFITPEMDVPEQLRNARKYKLSLILMTQYLDAIGNKEVEQAIDEECTTKITLPIKGENAGRIANRLGLDNDEYLTKLARYHALVEIEVDGDPRGPFEISLPAPVAPERSLAEAREVIVKPSLDRHGREPLTDQEISDEQILSGERERETTSETTTAKRHAQALQGIEDTAVRQGVPGEFVDLSDCLDKLNYHLDESFETADEAWKEVLQNIPDSQLMRRDSDDKVKVKDRAFVNVGSDVTSGGREHASLLADAYQPLTQLGFVVKVLDQGDGAANTSLPDGLATVDPEILDLDSLEDAGKITDRVNEFRRSEEHSHIVRLTGINDGYLEAEHSTTDSQPSQAIMNAIQAANDGHRCLYLIRPELAEKLHGYLSGEPAGCRSDHDVTGETRFYTRTGAHKIGGEKMTRPGTKENVWIYEEQTNQYVLRDSSGTEHARFDSPEEIYEDASAYDGGERTVTAPVIPWHELNEGSMADVERDIIIVPHRKDVDLDFDPEEDDEPRQLTPIDLELYREREANVRLIDLPESGSRTTATNKTDAISDTRYND